MNAYVCKPEDTAGVDASLAHEHNRLALGCAPADRHIKPIRYGSRTPYQADAWLLEIVFDYGEHDAQRPRLEEEEGYRLDCSARSA